MLFPFSMCIFCRVDVMNSWLPWQWPCSLVLAYKARPYEVGVFILTPWGVVQLMDGKWVQSVYVSLTNKKGRKLLISSRNLLQIAPYRIFFYQSLFLATCFFLHSPCKSIYRCPAYLCLASPYCFTAIVPIWVDESHCPLAFDLNIRIADKI